MFEGSWEQTQAILASEDSRQKVRADIDRYWRFLANGQWERLLYLLPEYDEKVAKTPFAKLVEESGKEPIDVV